LSNIIKMNISNESNYEGLSGNHTNEDIGEDDRRRDSSSRSSKYSDYEDDSIFEPDLDYEPEEDSSHDEQEQDENDVRNGDEGKKVFDENSVDEELVVKSKKRSFLSSDDDDIEVIDVINNETEPPKESTVKEEKKEHSRGSNYSDPRREEDESHKIKRRKSSSKSPKRKLSRSRERKESVSRRSIKREKSPERIRIKSEKYEKDSVRETIYSRDDLEKVKAFFAGAQNKRKALDSQWNKGSSKKFRSSDDGRKESKDDWLKEKLEREGKVFIKNYIPFPANHKSNFKVDIQSAFKEELNDEILITLTPTYCGLCFKDFDDDVVAWKHYTGANHKSTIKRFNRGTYKGHPPFWRMIHERLCEQDPSTLTERELYDKISDNYNVGDNTEKVKTLVKRNIDCLMQYDMIGSRNSAYFVKNKNVQEVRKIFENYFYEKKRKEDMEHQAKLDGNRRNSYGEYVPTNRRNYDDRSSSRSSRRSYEVDHMSSSRSRYPEDRRQPLPPRTSEGSYQSRHQALPQNGNPANQMLVVDPSKLRMLPNGQIMIKPDDVMSMRPGEVV